jgi:hypothetical protein
VVEEMMIESFEVGVGGVSMGECVLKMAMEGLAFLIIPSVHRAQVVFLGGGSGPSGVRVGLEGCIPNDG